MKKKKEGLTPCTSLTDILKAMNCINSVKVMPLFDSMKVTNKAVEGLTPCTSLTDILKAMNCINSVKVTPLFDSMKVTNNAVESLKAMNCINSLKVTPFFDSMKVTNNAVESLKAMNCINSVKVTPLFDSMKVTNKAVESLKAMNCINSLEIFKSRYKPIFANGYIIELNQYIEKQKEEQRKFKENIKKINKKYKEDEKALEDNWVYQEEKQQYINELQAKDEQIKAQQEQLQFYIQQEVNKHEERIKELLNISFDSNMIANEQPQQEQQQAPISKKKYTLNSILTDEQIKYLCDKLQPIFEGTFEQWQNVFSDNIQVAEKPIIAKYNREYIIALFDKLIYYNFIFYNEKDETFKKYFALLDNNKLFASKNGTIIKIQQYSYMYRERNINKATTSYNNLIVETLNKIKTQH